MFSLVKYLTERQELIIDMWIKEFDGNYPNQYDIRDLRKNGEVYIQLLREVEIPLNQHPLFPFIPHICEYHASHNTPIEQLLHSSHIWRKCLVKLIHEYLVKERLNSENAMPFFESLHERIDVLQREISYHYWQYAKKLVKAHEEKINQLHEDRLNLLGKMAANMAHEIKNPLFAIQGFMKLIRTSLSQESAQQVVPYIDVIDKECEGLYRHITTLLSFSKNDGNEEPLVKCSVDELIASVFSLVYPRLVAEDIDIEIIKENDSTVMVQKIGIQQVLSNLINNSIDALCSVDYSKKIKIRHGLDAGRCYISITDNGPGIPKEIKDKIFEPFMTTKKSGTGLGLSICRQIMSKNQGDLTCASFERDTTFTLTLAKECVVSC